VLSRNLVNEEAIAHAELQGHVKNPNLVLLVKSVFKPATFKCVEFPRESSHYLLYALCCTLREQHRLRISIIRPTAALFAFGSSPLIASTCFQHLFALHQEANEQISAGNI
jgi:hypothetical protein